MEGPNLSARTDDQPQTDPKAEVPPAGPVSGSPGAQQPTKESTTTAGGPGDGEGSASMEDGLVTTREAMASTAGHSGSEIGAAGIAPEHGSSGPEAREELTAPPEAAQDTVGPAVRPKSPPVVPPAAMEEEDVVEEIIRAEPQTQSV